MIKFATGGHYHRLPRHHHKYTGTRVTLNSRFPLSVGGLDNREEEEEEEQELNIRNEKEA